VVFADGTGSARAMSHKAQTKGSPAEPALADNTISALVSKLKRSQPTKNESSAVPKRARK
jgi:hypothetical protein